MALTKDNLISRLQTQLSLTKPQSQPAVERLFEILKDTLSPMEKTCSSEGQSWCLQAFRVGERGSNPRVDAK